MFDVLAYLQAHVWYVYVFSVLCLICFAFQKLNFKNSYIGERACIVKLSIFFIHTHFVIIDTNIKSYML